MLLKKFKSNHTFNFILFPLLGVLLWLKNLVFQPLHPFHSWESESLLFPPVFELLNDSMLVQNFVGLVLFLFSAFLILQLNNRYHFFPMRTMIPASLFVILASGLTGIHFLHPIYFGIIFVLFSIYRLLSAYDQPQPYAPAFDAGFFLGLAVLFYYNLIVLMPALLIGIGILSREKKWRDFVVLFIGFIIPPVFGASYAFYTDQLSELIANVEIALLPSGDFPVLSASLKGYLAFVVFLTLMGSVKILKDYDTKKVSTRKFFIVFLLIFICSIASILFIPSVLQEMLLIAIIPVTFLTANLFMFLKNRILGEILIYLLLFMVVLVQIIP